MRIPLACLAAAACVSAAPPPAPKPSSPSVAGQPDQCTPRAIHARTVDGRAILRDELARPGVAQPVDLYLAVEHREDGCSVPVVARQDVYRGGSSTRGWIHR